MSISQSRIDTSRAELSIERPTLEEVAGPSENNRPASPSEPACKASAEAKRSGMSAFTLTLSNELSPELVEASL